MKPIRLKATEKQEAFLQEVESFVKIVRNTKMADSGDFDQQRTSLFSQYRALHGKGVKLKISDVKEYLSNSQATLLEVLELGQEAEDKFDSLVSVISRDAGTTAIAVANFIKSPKGFELSSASSFEKFTDEELVGLFGSLFGVKLANEAVGALKSERIGAVLGYALSGLCTKDLESLEKSHPKASTHMKVEYLKERINQMDVEAGYNYSVGSGPVGRDAKGGVLEGDVVSVSAQINESASRRGSTLRGKLTFDHCFVAPDRVIVGMSTSAKDLAEQKLAFHKALVALEALSEYKGTSRVGNNYQGKSIEPFYFISGRYNPSGEVGKKQVGGAFLGQIGSLTLAQKQKLAQMPFFSMLGNCATGAEALSLAKYNVFISGVDTLNLYLWQQTQALKLQSGSPTAKHEVLESFMKEASGYVKECATLLSGSEVGFNLRKFGREGAGRYVQDLASITKSFVQVFGPVLSKEHFATHVEPMGKALDAFYKKASATAAHTDYAKDVEDIFDSAELLQNWGAIEKKVNRQLASSKEYKVVFEDKVSQNVEDLQVKASKVVGPELTRTQIKSLVRVLTHVLEQTPGLTRGQTTAQKLIEYLESPPGMGASGSIGTYASLSSLRVSANQLCDGFEEWCKAKVKGVKGAGGIALPAQPEEFRQLVLGAVSAIHPLAQTEQTRTQKNQTLMSLVYQHEEKHLTMGVAASSKKPSKRKI